MTTWCAGDGSNGHIQLGMLGSVLCCITPSLGEEDGDWLKSFLVHCISRESGLFLI